MGMAAQELSVVFFKFQSTDTVEKIEFLGREIAVGDLKQAIAEKKTLPRYDIVLVNDATKEVYARDGAMLIRGTSVTVRRQPPPNKKRPRFVEIENNDIWNREPKPEPKKEPEPEAPVQRRPCPEEYLCPLCRRIFRDPSIARCCGRSACSECLRQAPEAVACPLCKSPWAADGEHFVANQCLAETVGSLDLEYFILPQPKASSEDLTLLSVRKAPVQVWGPQLPSAPAPPAAPPPPGMLSQKEFQLWQQSMTAQPGRAPQRRQSSGTLEVPKSTTPAAATAKPPMPRPVALRRLRSRGAVEISSESEGDVTIVSSAPGRGARRRAAKAS